MLPHPLLLLVVGAALTPSVAWAPAPAPVPRPHIEDELPADVVAVRREGVLRVALPADRTSYLLVGGQVLGLELELLQAWADHLGVRLDVVVLSGVDERYVALSEGRVHAIAGRLSMDPRYDRLARWSAPVADSRLALVSPERVIPAAARRVVMPSEAAWRGRLSAVTLAALDPVVLPGAADAEDVLRRMGEGEVELALVREDLARLEATRQPLRVRPLPTLVASRVAFGATSPGLLAAFDGWLETHGSLVQELRTRYLHDSGSWARRSTDPMAVRETGRLSPYDGMLQRHGQSTGWDWRLLAAVAYQESRWRRQARSGAGAVGLMQLMPGTARQVQVWDRTDPDESIRGGADYLAWLDALWSIDVPDDRARLPLVLASYNVGSGHVADARRLALASGQDPDDWPVVATWLLRLSEPVWAQHPLVQYGRCRGSEPVHYVGDVLERWAHYRALAPSGAARG